MKYNILLPNAIWQNYDPQSMPLNEECIDECDCDGLKILTYRFDATSSEGGIVSVIVKFYSTCDKSPDSAILVTPEYHRMPSQAFIQSLAKSGFTVVVPDMAGNDNPPTQFPSEYEYGCYAKSGDHIRTVMPTAKETCQYLYTIIIKRTLVLIKQLLDGIKVGLIGLGDAVEVAMQAVGSGAPFDALACVNGSGYREYIKLNKYGASKELDMTDETVCWLSGVASAAYAKLVTCPAFIGIGTNGLRCDIDRVNNLVALLPSVSSISFSPKAGDYVLPQTFSTMTKWFKRTLDGQDCPLSPLITVNINDDGKIYATVECDKNFDIIEVDIYYSFGEYNHVIRDWTKVSGITVSEHEYIATLDVLDPIAPLFAFAVVEYEDGITLSSLEKYVELAGQPVKIDTAQKNTRIVYAAGTSADAFVENCEDEMLPRAEPVIIITAAGAKGVGCMPSGLKNYRLAACSTTDSDSLLQIEFYTAVSCNATITLLCKDEDSIKRYATDVRLQDTKGFFTGMRFRTTDFKDKRYMPLTTWQNVRALEISGCDAAIGNILFI
ncbi:MAG: hypothetical protein LBE09_07205 [Christensenellaceae bacterium]|jgi:hypothetical protein|nr:hypothetical protein [Christensenellaceae bacterium]